MKNAGTLCAARHRAVICSAHLADLRLAALCGTVQRGMVWVFLVISRH